MNAWEYFCFLAAFLMIFWVSIVYAFYPKLQLKNVEKLNLENLGNGDLLFLSGGTFSEKVIKFYHKSFYSHVAFIFEDSRGVENPTKENTLFVWESDLGQNVKDGPRIMRLVDKLKRWKGDKIGMIRKYNGVRPTTIDIMNIAKLNLEKGMDASMISWFFSNYPDSYIFKFLKGDNMFCTELVADTLQKLDIMESDRHPSSYTPNDLCRLVPKKGFYSFPIYFSL